MNYLGIVGSLRKDSLNRKLMLAVSGMLPADSRFEMADIGNLPLFNQDLEAAFPTEAQAFKDKIRAADAVLISTPEFNRSLPGALKNAIDWTSRPYGDNVWNGKKVMVMGASSGNISTALAQYDLKRLLSYLNAVFMGQPEVMLGTAQDKFDVSGALSDAKTKAFLEKATASFVAFVGR